MLSLPVAVMTLVSCTSAPGAKTVENAGLLFGALGFLLSLLIPLATPGGLATVCTSLPFCSVH
jgi:hypothetical protein